MLLKSIFSVLLLLASVLVTQGDIYMHSPRGSNNRLNENTANRRQANRVFDSQNNNRGGYNVGDATDQAANNDVNKQYQMTYFQSGRNVKNNQGVSNLKIEWTNQHGCGGDEDTNPNKMNCHLVFQYMCEPTDNRQPNDAKFRMRDGVNTDRQDYQDAQNNENKGTFENRKRNSVNDQRVYQEPFEWYDKCAQRERNKGLFTADQNLNGNDATKTRQNPNGNRNGYECPEERDYYPYWHPSDWKDIGILAENASMCEYFQKNSYNVLPKYECVQNWPNSNEPKHYSTHNNEKDCTAAGGKWTEFHSFLERATTFTTEATCLAQNNNANKIVYKWAIPIYGKQKECLVALDKPWCAASPFSRDNHLGNGVDLKDLEVDWKLPYFPSNAEMRCVLRIRYNISTDDYDPYNTDSRNNTDANTGVQSPVQQNPAVDIGAQNIPLRLAINTAQFGRTFQDRSHIFKLKPRTTDIGETANIQNINVRGKRGNIVQVYPAVEYDFYPTDLEISKNDLVHFQWTGSNTHNNQPPGGDGQTGDDGQGRGGTDRNNVLGLGPRGENYPLPMENPASIFNNVDRVFYQPIGKKNLVGKPLSTDDKLDIAVQMASSGYYHCVKSADCDNNSVERRGQMNNLLDNAQASFEGMVLRFTPGVYNYTCTRNNNFSNRSQKASLIVKN